MFWMKNAYIFITHIIARLTHFTKIYITVNYGTLLLRIDPILSSLSQ